MISNIELLETAGLLEARGSDPIALRVVRLALDVNKRARQLESDNSLLSIDINIWSQRFRNAERREHMLAIVAGVLAACLAASVVLLTVVMSA